MVTLRRDNEKAKPLLWLFHACQSRSTLIETTKQKRFSPLEKWSLFPRFSRSTPTSNPCAYQTDSRHDNNSYTNQALPMVQCSVLYCIGTKRIVPADKKTWWSPRFRQEIVLKEQSRHRELVDPALIEYVRLLWKGASFSSHPGRYKPATDRGQPTTATDRRSQVTLPSFLPLKSQFNSPKTRAW